VSQLLSVATNTGAFKGASGLGSTGNRSGVLELALPLEDFVGAAADGVDLRIGRALAAEEHHLARFVQS
jgi:hypothetical protein